MMLQNWPISVLIASFRGFFVDRRAGVDEEAKEGGTTWATGPGSWLMRANPNRRASHRTVQRHFEPSRLAGACQTQAYDQVVAAARTPADGPEPAVPVLAPPVHLFVACEGVAV
jgi:cytochrome P450